MGNNAYKFTPQTEDNKGEVESSISNREVLKYWKLARPSTELRIRRTSMYQTMARHPEDSVLAMAAAFGKIREEEKRQFPDPIVDNCVTEYATPWALQFQEDLFFGAERNCAAKSILEDIDYHTF